MAQSFKKQGVLFSVGAVSISCGCYLLILSIFRISQYDWKGGWGINFVVDIPIPLAFSLLFLVFGFIATLRFTQSVLS